MRKPLYLYSSDNVKRASMVFKDIKCYCPDDAVKANEIRLNRILLDLDNLIKDYEIVSRDLELAERELRLHPLVDKVDDYTKWRQTWGILA